MATKGDSFLGLQSIWATSCLGLWWWLPAAGAVPIAHQCQWPKRGYRALVGLVLHRGPAPYGIMLGGSSEQWQQQRGYLFSYFFFKTRKQLEGKPAKDKVPKSEKMLSLSVSHCFFFELWYPLLPNYLVWSLNSALLGDLVGTPHRRTRWQLEAGIKPSIFLIRPVVPKQPWDSWKAGGICERKGAQVVEGPVQGRVGVFIDICWFLLFLSWLPTNWDPTDTWHLNFIKFLHAYYFSYFGNLSASFAIFWPFFRRHVVFKWHLHRFCVQS